MKPNFLLQDESHCKYHKSHYCQLDIADFSISQVPDSSVDNLPTVLTRWPSGEGCRKIRRDGFFFKENGFLSGSVEVSVFTDGVARYLLVDGTLFYFSRSEIKSSFKQCCMINRFKIYVDGIMVCEFVYINSFFRSLWHDPMLDSDDIHPLKYASSVINDSTISLRHTPVDFMNPSTF